MLHSLPWQEKHRAIRNYQSLVETEGRVIRKDEEFRLLGALLVAVGLVLGIVQTALYVSLVGLLLGAGALLFLLRGRPAHLLRPAVAVLAAVSVQAVGPLTSLALPAGTALLIWANRDQLGVLTRLSQGRRWLLLGLSLVLVGLFLPWEASKGSFAGGFTHELAPLTRQPVSTYDPLAVWLPAEQLPGRQLLGALLPLLAWSGLLLLALQRRARLRRLGLPLLLGLFLWWSLQRSVLPGGLLYLTGTGLAGFALLWEGRLGRRQGRPDKPRTVARPAPGLRSGPQRPQARRGGAPG
jgi:hypothetical protein